MWHGDCIEKGAMTQIQTIIPQLRQLSELAAQERKLGKSNPQRAEIKRQIEALRALLPTAILAHHDRFVSRGKPSVAAAKGGFCGSCHLSVPRGRLFDLKRAVDVLNVCDHCGVFIYLPDGEAWMQSPPKVKGPREDNFKAPSASC